MSRSSAALLVSFNKMTGTKPTVRAKIPDLGIDDAAVVLASIAELAASLLAIMRTELRVPKSGHLSQHSVGMMTFEETSDDESEDPPSVARMVLTLSMFGNDSFQRLLDVPAEYRAEDDLVMLEEEYYALLDDSAYELLSLHSTYLRHRRDGESVFDTLARMSRAKE